MEVRFVTCVAQCLYSQRLMDFVVYVEPCACGQYSVVYNR
jgi:hypothetical protein